MPDEVVKTIVQRKVGEIDSMDAEKHSYEETETVDVVRNHIGGGRAWIGEAEFPDKIVEKYPIGDSESEQPTHF
jgi:hypothetical protein